MYPLNFASPLLAESLRVHNSHLCPRSPRYLDPHLRLGRCWPLCRVPRHNRGVARRRFPYHCTDHHRPCHLPGPPRHRRRVLRSPLRHLPHCCHYLFHRSRHRSRRRRRRRHLRRRSRRRHRRRRCRRRRRRRRAAAAAAATAAAAGATAATAAAAAAAAAVAAAVANAVARASFYQSHDALYRRR